ncbi:hypothetical protein BH10ACT10_BH10ACT10_10800 [soil metagenome]
MIDRMSDGGAASAVHEQREQASRARREAEGLRERLDAATTHADDTTARVQWARDRLTSETGDVAALESLSWSRILSTLKGSRATDLEREQAERDAARYAVADAEARDDLAWRDVEAAQAQLDLLGDVDRAFADALAAKEEWAARHDLAVGRDLMELAERRGVLTAEDQEGREAFDAGVAARTHLLHARQLLGSAQSWSTWDTFGGGGLVTDLMKYDKLDQVGDALRRADHALGAFSRELADVHVSGVEAVNLDGMTRTFDVFFDNIFTDLRVRSRIQDAGIRVEQALRSVEDTLQALHLRGLAIADELATLTRRRESLLSADPGLLHG